MATSPSQIVNRRIGEWKLLGCISLYKPVYLKDFVFLPVGLCFSGGSLNITSFDELDITVLYDIFRNVMKRPIPTKGWGKEPCITDINTGDDIERIRIHRNTVCHSYTPKMTTEDFNNAALELIEVRLKDIFF